MYFSHQLDILCYCTTAIFPNLRIMQFPPVTDFNQDPNIPFNTVFLTSTLRYESLGTVYTILCAGLYLSFGI